MPELAVLELVRFIRGRKFELYIQVLGIHVPWMFALDLTNYSRWLPVHIRDLLMLKKSTRFFSIIALDQNHEQENAIMKATEGLLD